ncbi:hypothetical protein C8R46DRAFT_1223881 [Mycena filopes]|nr:hypothetical protein C8R46DRAFT_1223881 [Mycena filopes]
MRFNLSVPAFLTILLSVLVEALPISSDHLVTNSRAQTKRQIFYKHYADDQQEGDEVEIENLGKREILYKRCEDEDYNGWYPGMTICTNDA